MISVRLICSLFSAAPKVRRKLIGNISWHLSLIHISDTDTFFVEATGVCAAAFERSGRFDIPIFADRKMVSRSVESPPAVADIQVIFRKLPVLSLIHS